MIGKIEGLAGCTSLDMVYLARNRIGRNGLDDVRGLLECPNITTLDLQNNKIDDPAILEEVLVHMPRLAVLYLQGNGCVNKIKNYRKTIISKIPTLKYLDDRPVFEDDRRNAEAFSRGGIEEERAERERIAEEKRVRDKRNRDHFNDMIKKAREERKAADAAKKAEERSASPAENSAAAEESKDEQPAAKMIDTRGGCTVEEIVEDEAPPELETVDADQLKQE